MAMVTIELRWNGKTVLKGEATSVAAYDVAQGFMRQFAGVEHKRYCEANLDGRLSEVLAIAANGGGWSRGYEDETGAASVSIVSTLHA